MDEKEMTANRREAIAIMQNPLNRSYYKQVLQLLKPKGRYGFPAMLEVFTREELVQIIEEAERNERDSEGR